MRGRLGLCDIIFPLDFRYALSASCSIDKVEVFSEGAFIRYLLEVKVGIVTVLTRKRVFPPQVAEEVEEASKLIKAEEVYLEEKRIRHPFGGSCQYHR